MTGLIKEQIYSTEQRYFISQQPLRSETYIKIALERPETYVTTYNAWYVAKCF